MYDVENLRRCMKELCDALEEQLEKGLVHQLLFRRYEEESKAVEQALDEAGLAHFLSYQNLRNALELEKQLFWLSHGMELGKYELDRFTEPEAD